MYKFKQLFSFSLEDIRIDTRIHYNTNTDHVGINSSYRKTNTNGGSKTNKKCALYLGVTVVEKVLSKVFKNVKRMPNGNKGYDFICGKGFKIDVKSACSRHVHKKYCDSWQFGIKRNMIADYFLCMAFDNRDNLNPKHIWLIPGKDVNDKTGIFISERQIKKWDYYKINKIGEIINCCNIMKE